MLRFKRPPQFLKFSISQKPSLPLVLKKTVAQVAEEEKVEEEVLKTPPPPASEEDLNQKLNWEMEILNKLTVQQFKESGVDCLGYKVSQNPVAQQCRVEIESLIESGADVNHKSSSGFAAIHFATFFNDISFVRFLIANSADVGAKRS